MHFIIIGIFFYFFFWNNYNVTSCNWPHSGRNCYFKKSDQFFFLFYRTNETGLSKVDSQHRCLVKNACLLNIFVPLFLCHCFINISHYNLSNEVSLSSRYIRNFFFPIRNYLAKEISNSTEINFEFHPLCKTIAV